MQKIKVFFSHWGIGKGPGREEEEGGGRQPEPWSRDPRALGVLAVRDGEWREGLRNGKEDKAALRAWPQVTGTACAGALKEMISRVLDSSAVDIRKARAHFVSRA